MTAAQFRKQYEADASITRHCKVIVVETTDGYIFARAESAWHDVAYCASRTTSKAIGRACSAALFGEYRAAEAFETADEALAHARTSPVDYH